MNATLKVSALHKELRAAWDATADSAARAVVATAVCKALALDSAAAAASGPCGLSVIDGGGFSTAGQTAPFSSQAASDHSGFFLGSAASSATDLDAHLNLSSGGGSAAGGHPDHYYPNRLHPSDIAGTDRQLSLLEVNSSRASSSGGSVGGDGVVMLAISCPTEFSHQVSTLVMMSMPHEKCVESNRP